MISVISCASWYGFPQPNSFTSLHENARWGMVRLMKNGFCLRAAEKTSSFFLLPLSVPHTWSSGLIWLCSRQVNSRKSSKCKRLHNLPWHTFAPTLLRWVDSIPATQASAAALKPPRIMRMRNYLIIHKGFLLIFMICVPCPSGSHWNSITEFVFSMVTCWLILPIFNSYKKERKAAANNPCHHPEQGFSYETK